MQGSFYKSFLTDSVQVIFKSRIHFTSFFESLFFVVGSVLEMEVLVACWEWEEREGER